MEKFTPEQLEAIEAVLRDFHQVPDGPNFKIAEEKADAILSALTRPAHSFREGEIVVGGGNAQVYYGKVDNGQNYRFHRHLTLSEMPKAVEDLRKEIVRAIECICGEENKPYYKSLKEALAAFDAAVGET